MCKKGIVGLDLGCEYEFYFTNMFFMKGKESNKLRIECPNDVY